MQKTTRHVVSNPKGGWSVRQSGAARATRTFANQADAVRYAKQVAKREGTELYIHRRDGTIREKDTYGPNPMRSRDAR